MRFPTSLLRIRLIQVRRELEGLGPLYSIAILLVFSFLVYVLFRLYRQPGNAGPGVSLLIALAVLSIHFSRRDKDFVFRHIAQPVNSIFTEYFLLTLPFTATCLFSSQWYHFPLMAVAFYGIAWLRVPFKQRTVLPHLSRLIPARDFEWLSGVRKSYILLGLTLLLALALCWLRIAPLIFLWLFTSGICSFYQQCEPLHILLASSESGKSLLHTKIKRHGAMLLMVLTPVLLINSLFNPELAWVNALFLLMQLSVLLFAITLKYATYRPNQDLKANSILLSLAVIGSVIPVLLPLPFIMSIRNYFKALRNLKFYFHDQH